MENVIEDFDSFTDVEIEERLLDELEELNILEKFKSLFDTEKRLLDELDELNIKKNWVCTLLNRPHDVVCGYGGAKTPGCWNRLS